MTAYIDECVTLTGLTLREAFNKLREDFPQTALRERVGSGGNLSSINPAYRTERVSEVFGMCGVGWNFGHDGIEVVENDRIVRVWFKYAYLYKGGIQWSENLHAHGMGNVHKGMNDGDARKSAVTDGLTKAVSMLGVGISVFKGEQSHGAPPKTRKPKPQPRENESPKQADSQPSGGREYNKFYIGGDDPTATIPAKFKTKPKSGKSYVYIIDGKDVVFPISQVKSQTPEEVEVTAWIADKKINDGDIAPELVCYNSEGGE